MGKWKRGFFKLGEDGLFRAVASDQTKGPVGDGFAVVVPMVGPSVESGSGESGIAAEFEGSGEELGLELFSCVGYRVQTR